MSSQDPLHQSVTLWLHNLKQGSDEAASQLWRRYFQRLIRLANVHLKYSPRRVSDEEDIAVCVFQSLCDGAENGRFEQLDDRDDLWKLLIVMTRHKALNQLRHQRSQKRGGANVRGHSALGNSEQGDPRSFDVFFGREPTPQMIAEIQEEQDLLLELLDSVLLRQIAQLRWQGYSVDEVAERVQISARSVKRKLALIREIWIARIDETGI